MISVIDYGCGNTHAFINVFKRLNLPVNIARTVAEVEKTNKIVLPGVGSFDYVMNSFNKSGLREIVEKKVFLYFEYFQTLSSSCIEVSPSRSRVELN